MKLEDIKIEKGIPMPPRAGGRPAILQDMLRPMEIGDSFIDTKGTDRWSKTAQKLGIKVVTRKQPDGTYRIWRFE